MNERSGATRRHGDKGGACVIDLKDRVVIVTGAGGGLGRTHALALAEHGARVIVNDLGDGADAVAREIIDSGGMARAIRGSVTDEQAVAAMVEETLTAWGRIDILVNNAGILRDKSFAKMSLDDFRLVVDVHLMGAAICTSKVWGIMRGQAYGRVVMTTSSSGLYGNFGQANYGAAKMALVGLMQTLAIEGAKYDIRVNCLAPTAATQMTEGVLPDEQLALLAPRFVSPAVVVLAAEDAPTRAILCAGAGGFELANITMTQGIHIPGDPPAAEAVQRRWVELTDRTDEFVPGQGWDQSRLELSKAGFAVEPA
jgi:NAD(P)-dependent dehydrogenase (short-subunit alcohol dehydrogenase family)